MNRKFVSTALLPGVVSGFAQTYIGCANGDNFHSGTDVEVKVNVNANGGVDVKKEQSKGIVRFIYNGYTHTPLIYFFLRVIGAHKGMAKLFEPDQDGAYSFWQIVFIFFAAYRTYEFLRSCYRIATLSTELGLPDEILNMVTDFSIPLWVIRKICVKAAKETGKYKDMKKRNDSYFSKNCKTSS